jgi:protein-tyrosine-phosphatase
METTCATLPADEAFFPALAAYLRGRAEAPEARPDSERRALLDRLSGFVRERRAAGDVARLVFICTHNSRRSHFGQLWAAAAAAWHGVGGVETYSGGTEATALEPRAIAALLRAGMTVERTTDPPNPRFAVRFGPAGPALDVFSKTFDGPPNPREGFAAVMTCAEADEACPFVPGAAVRIPLRYEDPKKADGTPEEAAVYDARCAQIASEMLYVFARARG